ncbi:trypsin-like serine peptidase [Actinocorallia longicatena]|uniref:Peptidase S1 domain-containing protein n=1 Tax=Actinocorallia longicatena TaxID=111803 RepID=A0ABP6PYS3_9ACTN
MRKLIVGALGAGLLLTGCGRAAQDASAAPPPTDPPTSAPAVPAARPDPAATVGTLVNLRTGKRTCTATVVARDLVMTAAHCAGRKMAFVPRYARGERPAGTWKVTAGFADPSWVKSRDDDADLAFLSVAPLAGKHLGEVTGISAPVFTAKPAGTTVTILSYPNASEVLLRSSSRAQGVHGDQDLRVSGPALPSGSSGSPFFSGGVIVAVLGGYLEGGNSLRVSYATVLDARAERLYQRALATM